MTRKLMAWQRWLLHLVFRPPNVGTIHVRDASFRRLWVWSKGRRRQGREERTGTPDEELEASYRDGSPRRP